MQTAAIETLNLGSVRYERRTEWRRDVTIPWDLAWVTGTLTANLSPTLKAGTCIYSKHSTRQCWAELQARAV